MTYIVHKAVELTALNKKLQADIENHTYLLSPKYDGCHVIFLFDSGKFLAARSRTNETVHSMDHIAVELLTLYPFLQNDKHAVMGEAWISGVGFSEISGTFRRQSPQPQLCFVPFDTTWWRYDTCEDGRPVLGQCPDELTGSSLDLRTYDERLGALHRKYADPASGVLQLGTTTLEQGDAIMVTAIWLARAYKERGGYDGCVLARADGLYQVGAGKGGEFIKIKPLISHTCVCLDVEHAKGGKTGKNTGALVVQFNGKEQRVSTGLTQAEMDNLDQFVGKHIEVEAMGLTVNGLLREPRYKGIRADVL